MPLQWRMSFDEPYYIATEPGGARAVHCRNFRPGADSFSDTWRDELTGLVMLAPSFTKRDWHDQAKALSTFRHSSGFWKRSRRSTDLVEAFTTVKPQGTNPLLVEIVIDVTIQLIDEEIGLYDSLKWALESHWLLSEDEGFAIYLSNLDDELIRKRNWLYIQWANIGLHIGQGGQCRVYRYNAGESAAPTLIDEFNLCPPSEMSGRGSWFVFLPIPLYGLLVYHSLRPPADALAFGSANSQVSRGHLIEWNGYRDQDEHEHLFVPSPLRIGLNPYQQYHFGVATLTYPSSGAFMDAPFDPGWKPSTDPSTCAPILLPTREQTVLAGLRNADNSADWVAGTDRKGRMLLALTTSDTRYTPFVQGYGAIWDPVIEARDTTPVTVSVRKLELTQDSEARIEGTAEIMAPDADMRAIVRRGDTTFKIESSDDGGSTWLTEAAGLAKQFRVKTERYGALSSYDVVECKLYDMMERLREQHILSNTAFDGMTMGDALNVVLRLGGFAAITIPEPLNSQQVPISKQGETWRYAVKLGDTGEEIVNKLLILGRRQYRQWILAHDPDSWEWTCVQRTRDDTDKWTLTQDSGDHDVSSKIVRYKALSFDPLPPECNSLSVAGVTSPDPQGTKIVAYCKNTASVTDPEDDDYLGRIVIAQFAAEEALTQGECNMLARRIEPRAMHHAVRASVDLEHYVSDLLPNTYVDVLDRDDTVIASMWVKRRTVSVTAGCGGYREQSTLELDSIWENSLQ